MGRKGASRKVAAGPRIPSDRLPDSRGRSSAARKTQNTGRDSGERDAKGRAVLIGPRGGRYVLEGGKRRKPAKGRATRRPAMPAKPAVPSIEDARLATRAIEAVLPRRDSTDARIIGWRGRGAASLARAVADALTIAEASDDHRFGRDSGWAGMLDLLLSMAESARGMGPEEWDPDRVRRFVGEVVDALKDAYFRVGLEARAIRA